MIGVVMIIAILTAMTGIGTLRWSWSRQGRRTAITILAWSLLLVAVIMGAAEAGAWGVAVVSLAAMGFAMGLLAWAAMRSPTKATASTVRRITARSEPKQPLHIAARIATFLIVVIGGSAASISFAIAVRMAGAAAGWSEADANAAAFVIAPLVWGVIAAVMLIQASRRAQYFTLVVTSLPLIPALLTGS